MKGLKMKRSIRVALILALVGIPAFAQYGVPAIPPMPPVASPAASAAAHLDETNMSVEAQETVLEGLRARLGELDERVGQRVRTIYRFQRAGMLPVAGGFDAMLSHLGRMDRLQRMLERDLSERRDVRVEANIAESRLATARAAHEEASAALASAQAAVPPDHGLNTFFDPNYTPRLPVAPVPQYGMRLRGRPARTFQQQRGALPMPVAGGGDITDASREDGSGLEFAVPAGRAVNAVAEGTIAFARRYGVYGTMVVVDHGQSFFTVYAGLGRTDVAVGQSVHAQQSLGASEGPVYFEVRRGTRSLDPRSWIGL